MTQEEEIKLAESKGFRSVPDKDRGDGWAKFIKDDLWVWRIRIGSNIMWQTAFKDEKNYFIKHKHFDSLEDALDRREE